MLNTDKHKHAMTKSTEIIFYSFWCLMPRPVSACLILCAAATLAECIIAWIEIRLLKRFFSVKYIKLMLTLVLNRCYSNLILNKACWKQTVNAEDKKTWWKLNQEEDQFSSLIMVQKEERDLHRWVSETWVQSSCVMRLITQPMCIN